MQMSARPSSIGVEGVADRVEPGGAAGGDGLHRARARRTARPPPRRACWARTPGADAGRPARWSTSQRCAAVADQRRSRAPAGWCRRPRCPGRRRPARGPRPRGRDRRRRTASSRGDQRELDVAVAAFGLLRRPGRAPTGSKSHSAAIRERRPAGSKSVMPRVAVRPAASRSQKAGTPMPPGATTPMPVTATRRVMTGPRRCVPATSAPMASALGVGPSVSTWPSCGRGASGPRWKTMRASTSPTLRKRWRMSIGIIRPWSGRSGVRSRRRGPLRAAPQTTYTNSSEYGW